MKRRTVGVVLAAVLAIKALPAAALDAAGVEAAVANAKTKADHEAIAEVYEQEASRLQDLAQKHVRMAKTYREHRHKSILTTSRHCERLANSYEIAAEDNKELALLHRQMADMAKE